MCMRPHMRTHRHKPDEMVAFNILLFAVVSCHIFAHRIISLLFFVIIFFIHFIFVIHLSLCVCVCACARIASLCNNDVGNTTTTAVTTIMMMISFFAYRMHTINIGYNMSIACVRISSRESTNPNMDARIQLALGNVECSCARDGSVWRVWSDDVDAGVCTLSLSVHLCHLIMSCVCAINEMVAFFRYDSNANAVKPNANGCRRRCAKLSVHGK